MISAAAEAELSRRLAALEAETGRQFAVALFQSLEGESLEEYANRLFRHWKIGRAKKNDGLLFCLFVKERRWRVETGFGLEGVLTDLEAAALVEEHAVPHLKSGRVDQGVSAAVSAFAAKLGSGGAPLRGTRRPRSARNIGDLDSETLATLVLAGVFAVLFLAFAMGGFSTALGRRRRRHGWGYGSSSSWDWGGGGFLGSGDFGGFSGGGGSSGGGGASGSW